MNLHDLFLRFKAIFQRGYVEAELDEELQTHLELQIRKHIAAGMSVKRAGISEVSNSQKKTAGTRGVSISSITFSTTFVTRFAACEGTQFLR